MSQDDSKRVSMSLKRQDDLTVTIIGMNAFWTKPREWMHTHYCATPVLQQKALTFLSYYLRKETLVPSQSLYKLNLRFLLYVCHLVASCIDSECMDSASYIQWKFLYTLLSAVQMKRIDLKGLRAVRHIMEKEHTIQ